MHLLKILSTNFQDLMNNHYLNNILDIYQPAPPNDFSIGKPNSVVQKIKEFIDLSQMLKKGLLLINSNNVSLDIYLP